MLEFIIPSVLIILAFMIVFHIVSAIYCLKLQTTKVIYSYSKLVLFIAISLNIIEIALSLIQGMCCTKTVNCEEIIQIYLALLTLFIGNSFYMTIILRAHRLFVLSSLESGNFTLNSFDRLKAQLGDLWYLLIIAGGSFILSSPYSSYIIYAYNSGQKVLNDLEMYEVFMGITISFESILLASIIFLIIRFSIPTIVKVELIFQLIAWTSALLVLRNSIVQRFYFLIPIRNFIMMLIIIISIYEVNKNFKLPLPPEIDLDLVLESEEFYKAFKKFLINRDMQDSCEILNILLKIRIFKESTGSFDCRVLVDSINEARYIGRNLKDVLTESVNNGHADEYIEAEDICYKQLEDGPFKLFIVSEEFIDALSEY